MKLLHPEGTQGMETYYCTKDRLYAYEMPPMDASDNGYIVYYQKEESWDETG